MFRSVLQIRWCFGTNSVYVYMCVTSYIFFTNHSSGRGSDTLSREISLRGKYGNRPIYLSSHWREVGEKGEIICSFWKQIISFRAAPIYTRETTTGSNSQATFKQRRSSASSVAATLFQRCVPDGRLLMCCGTVHKPYGSKLALLSILTGFIRLEIAPSKHYSSIEKQHYCL